MPKKTLPSRPPRNFVNYFSLVQEIGLRLEEYGKTVGESACLAPAMDNLIVSDLECVRAFCERAIVAVNRAQADWSKLP